ncbi:MAG: AsmA-like C-terminal region-containing protein [Flavobacteriaceae bacterium]
MIKKIFKWTAIILAVLVVALAVTPFLFKDKIKDLVLKTINENLDATVNFSDVDLSLLKSFPKASVSITDLSIINKAPFEGDTLVFSEVIDLKMSVKELFKSEGEAMNIEGIFIKNALVNLVFNKDGVGNFDIALKDEEEKEEENDSESAPFALSLQNYEIENLRFIYLDQGSQMAFALDEINHKGKGDFTGSVVDLDTYTTTNVSFISGDNAWVKNLPLTLDAVLNLDLENSKYTFKENMALINKLPLEFDGFLQLKEEGQEYDLTFSTPTTLFSNFLGLIPSAYAGSLENIKTTGEFSVKGAVKGTLTDTTIPTLDIVMASDNASFKYPDLPKAVENIVIDVKIKNETGLEKDTYVDLDKLSFRIDQDVFNAKAKLSKLTENMLVDAKMNGTINLANLSGAYPIQLEKDLSGIVKADLELGLDMNSIEQEKYENVKASGTMNLTAFRYEGEELAKPLEISEADLKFNPSHVALSKLDVKTGKSDIQLSGTLDNFYGFMFKDQTLKGNFNLNSNHLEISDFMTATPEGEQQAQAQKTTPTDSEPVKIPAFLDCTLTAKANEVVYDNLVLKNVSGKLLIKDETVALQNVLASIFGGQIGLNGNVSTQEETPVFDMNLNLDKVDIMQSFTQMEMLKNIAPIAGVINGKLSSTIKLGGNLDAKELTPDLNSLTGDLLGQLLDTKVNAENSKLLSTLDSNLSFVDLSKLNLNNLKAQLAFEDGKVHLKPLDFKYEDIKIGLSGTHGFDQNMQYGVTFDVPAKYLGREVTELLSKLSGNEAKNLVVPVKANLTGSFSDPKVSTDMKQVVTNLTTQIVEYQKNELINKGKDALSNAIGGAIGKDSLNIPTTKEEIKEEVEKEIEKKKEEVKEEVKEKVKDKTKDALKNLFGK